MSKNKIKKKLQVFPSCFFPQKSPPGDGCPVGALLCDVAQLRDVFQLAAACAVPLTRPKAVKDGGKGGNPQGQMENPQEKS